MFVRLPRRGLLAGGLVIALFLVGGALSGPLVRAEVAAEATRRHIEARVAAVRFGWLVVRLVDVDLRPTDIQGIRGHADEVRIEFGLGVRRIAVHGMAVSIDGTREELVDRYARWRDSRSAERTAVPPQSPRRTPVVLDAMSIRWNDDASAEPRVAVHGLDAVWNQGSIQLKAAGAKMRLHSTTVEVSDAAAVVSSAGEVSQARAATALVEVTSHSDVKRREPSPASEPLLEAPQRAAPSAPQSPRGETAPLSEPGAPLVPLPDLHAAWVMVAALTREAAEHVSEGADLGVDALTWKITHPQERVAFTIGPGTVRLARSKAGFELNFSTDSHATGTPLAVRATLATDGRDDAVTLEGGPVSLSLLGIQEGAAGLVDVAQATVTGRARVVLADQGRALTFDGEVGTRGLSIHNQRLAPEVVRGIDLALRARGVATAGGELRIDDLGAAFGAVRVAAGGVLEQRADRVVGAFHFDVPTTGCQSLLDSVPGALLPALQGTEMSGSFGARGQFAFDTRSLDDLTLDYDVRDLCRIVRVPPELARTRFEQPFVYRTYLPDGTTEDDTTGPGSSAWTPLDEISPYMQVAVLTTEDGAFPRHHGFNRASIRSSIIANLKARRFVRGASTITMQLAKNLFLARDKTLSRKLEEVVLTDYLEQTFSKDELMELYLNVIEFGPSVYGITAAADHYFGRTPAELNLGECLFLSSLLPAPLRYGAMRDSGEVTESWMRTLHTLMQIAHRTGRINDAELAEAQKETIAFWRGGERPPARPPVRAHLGVDGETDDVTTTPSPDPPPSP